MTDQELVLSALRQVGLIIAEHLELGMTDADQTITQVVAVLDTSELADAMNRLEQGFGLRGLPCANVFLSLVRMEIDW